ncbi:MAG: hypothetical protein IPI15_17690 [Saprospiraceae bacterium]|uniref:hypothetical protein n=1 Tax=Candidatus Brachybacter algidus TaxID=2982024 RepID=UPI00257B6850|nr:hypothetical protein [Candidatus Brachybacter algidus]MBK7605363.1 hypothetical protein [Candidatus Brachybacter algidus]
MGKEEVIRNTASRVTREKQINFTKSFNESENLIYHLKDGRGIWKLIEYTTKSDNFTSPKDLMLKR